MTDTVKVRTLTFILLLLFSVIFALHGCGDAVTESDSDTPATPADSVTQIALIASSTQLNSSGIPAVTLTAIVKDSSNRAVSDAVVAFLATSGSLIVNSATTDAAGQATATLGTGGNQANRTITVRATCGTATTTINIAVIGTTIEISGQDGLAYGTQATYTITLKDSAGTGIPNQTITLSSVYNTLSATSITTNSSGQGTVDLTASDTGGHQDTLTASGFGAVGTKTVSVNPVTFTFTSPASGSTVNINTPTDITVNYTISSVPQAGVTILFTTSRGVLSASSAITDASGNATIQIQSSTTGEAVITATIADGPSTQLVLEFVSSIPATIAVQANPSVISMNLGGDVSQRSMITAVLLDSANNPVKDKKVNFTLTTDYSGGSLSPSTATTSSAGVANVYYIAGPAPSGTNGVIITASVEGMALTGTVSLTVGGSSLFIEIGTGNIIFEYNPQTYRKDFTVVVTDSAGRGISDAQVTASLTPLAYLKGYYSGSPGAPVWNLTLTSSHTNPPLSPYADPMLIHDYCGNEDLSLWPDTRYFANGILDTGEDYNSNGALDPGNIASVTGSVTTDEYGLATVSIFYPKEYATWVYVRLDVTVYVAGTEGTAHRTHLLTYAVDDYKDILPPDSPFGISTSCAVD